MTLSNEEIKAAADRAEARSEQQKSKSEPPPDPTAGHNSHKRDPGDVPDDFIEFVGKSDIPAPSPLAVRIAMKKLGITCTFDEFHSEWFVQGGPIGRHRVVVDDAMIRRLREMIHLYFHFDPGERNTPVGVRRACEANRFHPIKQYLESIPWDGAKRLDRWLITYMQVPDTEFVRAVSRITLIASVARIYEPGTKFDYITVLESPEGYNKSEALRLLYGEENFNDQSILGLDPKVVEETLRGMWGIECSELAGIRKGDLEKIKAQLSRRKDRVRRAWDHFTSSASRTAIVWGTTNDQEYLRAQSGTNRRFFPIAVGRIDLAALRRDRDQLWAEAYDRWFYYNESVMLPEKLWPDAAAERKSRTQEHPWADVLVDAAVTAARQIGHAEQGIYQMVAGEERIASSYLISLCGVPMERRTAQQYKDIGLIMREMGWKREDCMKIGDSPVRGYSRPVDEAALPDPCT